MNNKFTNGARRAGVMLASLVLLGVSGAWAAAGVVNVRLDSAKLSTVMPAAGTLNTIYTWRNSEATPQTVTASVYTRTSGTSVVWSDTLYLNAGTNVDTVNVTGTLPTGTRVKQIQFTGNAVFNINNGTVIKGLANSSTTNSGAVSVFLYATGGTDAKIRLNGGEIESYAQTLIQNVGDGGANDFNRIGATGAGGNTLKLTSHGSDAAIKGEFVEIPSPGQGSTYEIVSDNIAIEAVDSVLIGGASDVTSGIVTIRGWNTATGTTVGTSGAVRVTGGTVANPNTKITVYGREGRVTISSKGKYVLESPNKTIKGAGTGDNAIYVKQARIEHLAAAGVAGAVVFMGSVNEAIGSGALNNPNDPPTAWAGNGANITLDGVTVINGTSATNAVAGSIARTNGKITITGGSFAPASGATGNAIETTDTVRIKSAKIWSSGASGVPDYVVVGYVVFIEAGAGTGDTAIVAWAGTGKDVGGVKARDSVYITANGTRRAEVRVGNGNGTAVYVDGLGQFDNNTTALKAQGTRDGSAYIRAASGRAIVVENNSKITDPPPGLRLRNVILDDAIVSRTAPFGAKSENLIDVKGANVRVDGSSTTRSAINVAAPAVTNISPVTVSNGIGIYAVNNTPDTNKLNGVGGWVLITAGSVHGATGAIVGERVAVAEDWNIKFSKKAVDIRSQTGVTVKSNKIVKINNRNAKIVNVSGILSTEDVASAVIWSTDSAIIVYNVDSISANTQATALLAKTKNKAGTSTTRCVGDVVVYGGVVRSGTGPAIVASGKVTVHREPLATGGNTLGGAVLRDAGDLDNRADVVVSSGATNSAYSSITTEFSDVYVGYAKVEATGATGYASAIKNANGDVLVDGTTDNSKTLVASTSGSAINVNKGNIYIAGGEIKSEGKASLQSGNFVAAIYVQEGNVHVGNDTALARAANQTETTSRSILTSDGNALAIFANGGGLYYVSVGSYAEMNIRGMNAGYGGIKVLGGVNVNFDGGKLTVTQNASKAFAIEAVTGDVRISADSRIISKEGNAITTSGGKIEVHDVVDLIAEKGVLIWAKKNPTSTRAGLVTINNADTILNRFGVAIKAEDSLIINHGLILTHTDTAVTTGTATFAGTVEINGGLIWATGAYQKSSPVAVSSRRVIMYGGTVWANTARESAEDAETYNDASATAILLRNGGGFGALELHGGYIHGWGANTGIDNRDSSVIVHILPATQGADGLPVPTTALGSPIPTRLLYNEPARSEFTGIAPWTRPGYVTVKAGTGGTAIKSVGSVNVDGQVQPSEDSKDDEGLKVSVYLGGGNGRDSRVVLLPVKTGILRKDLWLFNAFVEAGSNGAIALETDIRALSTVDHSVVLVRDGSTAIEAKGGVRIDGGYVEVLATENNNEGTAISSNEIRIDGGKGELVDKSEVHSKGTAVVLTGAKEGAVVEITGVVHLSGKVASNTTVGSSVLGDTAIVTMGSIDSRNLWNLSTFSDNTELTELGKTLIVPVGVTVQVADNGSRLETEESDTVKISGIVTTVGKQAGAQFINSGKIIVEDGGNVKFNKVDFNSFKNNDGLIVLKTGSKFDDSLLVHDTGSLFMLRKYTYLKWADSLSEGVRGPGAVVIPPIYATLYGDQNAFVSEDDLDIGDAAYWSATSERTDSVYSAHLVKYPIDKRYKPYLQTDDFPAEGDFSVSGTDVIRVGTEGSGLYTVLFTEAGTFKRTATITNEAGTGTKTYTHHITRVGLKQIKEWQSEGSSQNFFDGFLVNKDERVVDRAEDTVLVWNNTVEVKYTGSTAKLLDGIQGAHFTSPTYENLDNPTKPIYFSGLGVHQFWYKGAGETFYPRSSVVPTKVGTYEVWASFSQGLNFDRVPDDENSLIYIGTLNVVPGDLSSVFNVKDNIYQIGLELEGRKAYSNVQIPLPNLNRYGAAYENRTDVQPASNSTGAAALSGTARILNDSVLTFNIRNTSEYGQFIEFDVGITPTSEPENLEQGLFITVRVDFLTGAEMKMATPILTVNYRNEKLTGLLPTTRYKINETEITGVSEVDIDEEWVGTTISVVALPPPLPYSYKAASDVASIAIGTRPEVSDALRAVKGDSASTTAASDGRLTGTSVAMEYKLSTGADSTWKLADAVVTQGLRAGTYNVRLAPTATSFASASVNVTIFAKAVSVAETDRVIPGKNVTTEAAVAPVAKATSAFSAGPSPVSKNAGKIAFFSAKQVKGGTLYVFDASGNAVAKIAAKPAGKQIGVWNLKDKSGNAAPEGSYIVKGTLLNKDGTKEKVTSVFNVAK